MTLKISKIDKRKNLSKKDRLKDDSDSLSDYINLLQKHKDKLDLNISKMT